MISGARIQKWPLTHPDRAFPGSACVSAATDWQGLDAPLIVELFTVCVLGRTPEVVGLRLVGVATARLPTPACVKRTCRALHPNGHHGFGPSPAGGFAVQAPLTRFGHDRPAALQRQACPARPHSPFRRWNRIWRLRFVGQRITSRSLPRTGRPTLVENPALRDTDVTGGKPIPLAWW